MWIGAFGQDPRSKQKLGKLGSDPIGTDKALEAPIPKRLEAAAPHAFSPSRAKDSQAQYREN
jgi:hypothetical protein